MKPVIVIAEFMDEAAVASLATRVATLYEPDLVDRPDDLETALSEARALIVRNRMRVDATLLAMAPALKHVGRLGVGLDNIDLAACKARGVGVHPAPGANNGAVAEYVLGAALILLRPAFLGSSGVMAGAWPRSRAVGREIAVKCAGLIGFGSTARETASRLGALGMRILAYDPMLPDDAVREAGAEPHGLDDLLAQADLVSLHVPLTETTRHLIDARALGLMKPAAILVNAARGGVLDEAALCAALRAGHLGGAALDVFEHEPVDAGHGALFNSVPRLILTPHIAGVTEESNVRVSALIAGKILGALDLAPAQ